MGTLCSVTCRKTFRKRIWDFIETIADIERTCQVVFYILLYFYLIVHIFLLPFSYHMRKQVPRQHRGGLSCVWWWQIYFIPEKGQSIYSHRFKKSVLQYEVVIFIKSGDIMWSNGTYKCGRWHDIICFGDTLYSNIETEEREKENDGYVKYHPRNARFPKVFFNSKEFERTQQRRRNSSETEHNHFADWDILCQI